MKGKRGKEEGRRGEKRGKEGKLIETELKWTLLMAIIILGKVHSFIVLISVIKVIMSRSSLILCGE